MARRPEIPSRPGCDEAQRLVRIARTRRDRVPLRRAGIVLASMQGRSTPEIAVNFATKQRTVRELINAFKRNGFTALDPKHAVARRRRSARRSVNRSAARASPTLPGCAAL
jgi:transposase